MRSKFTNFEKLFEAVKKLGVTSFPRATVSGWEKNLLEGLIDIESADDIVIGSTEDLLFAVNPENGNIHKIILYIPQRPKFLVQKWGYPKYHLFHCKTTALEQFFNGKNEKYRISSRTDGKFHFKLLGEYEVLEEKNDLELEFCGNCLKTYAVSFNKSKDEFDLKEFFDINFSSFYREPTFKYDHDDIPNLYVRNWNELATKYKKQKNHTCQSCKWSPGNQKEQKYIHAHHIDGLKYNNKLDNIKILCIYCHANQDHHDHMKGLPDYLEFTKKHKVMVKT